MNRLFVVLIGLAVIAVASSHRFPMQALRELLRALRRKVAVR